MLITDTKIQLQNKTSVLEADLHGGAITDFHLKENPVNPLSFRFSKDRMPANNKAGAAYQGHFICAGRWGEPSTGEINTGIPNHGEPANIEWQLNENDETGLAMETTAHLEGLHVQRKMQMNEHVALCHVTETITNINPLGRLYQIVQHPTIAVPFLDGTTVINCNATTGFNYLYGDQPSKHIVNWPVATDDNKNAFDLRNPQKNYNSVFSFIVDPKDNYGWLTAYSPAHQLVLGYVWQRKDYSWINLWQHFENGIIKYRGLEFGTTGLHQPFQKIIENNNLEVFNEPTVAYIDAGEQVTKEYACFLFPGGNNFRGIEQIEINDGVITAVEKDSGKHIDIGNVNFTNHHEK
ncbi:hypothetical protein FRZ67_04885 [Panacibacter ginsenosidivorans]|uniref:Aldose 1-epimerase n=1 Tax=Panacibacter ginsenosidivorans TaxID=1813871 RepID=A0A5B8V7J7_9BACT|nr:hypothetical protein [Panacibacter ginsenosidivorans]QEC66666.1 hypothetical protein FRZ67_04885 [Panacibacter ginsenosidivorans]